MFENIFNGMFGKVAPGMCRLTMNGKIAVKCSNGYKTYNVDNNTLTNVTNFCFNVGEELFFVIPTAKVSVGDIILVQGKPKCVISFDKKIIKVIDYENSEVREVIPERHIFMGSTFFYGKIVSMFGNSVKNGKDLMRMMMLGQMMGNSNGSNGGGIAGGLGQIMAMSMFMGGKENPFEDMFDLSLDFEDNEEEEKTSKENEK